MVFNAADVCEYLSITADELADAWAAAALLNDVHQLSPHVQCGYIKLSSKKPVYVLNGFFLKHKKEYTYKGGSIHYFSIRWSAMDMSWANFADK